MDPEASLITNDASKWSFDQVIRPIKSSGLDTHSPIYIYQHHVTRLSVKTHKSQDSVSCPFFVATGYFRYINLFWFYHDFISFHLFLFIHFTLSIFVHSFIFKELYCCIFFLYVSSIFVHLFRFTHLVFSFAFKRLYYCTFLFIFHRTHDFAIMYEKSTVFLKYLDSTKWKISDLVPWL